MKTKIGKRLTNAVIVLIIVAAIFVIYTNGREGIFTINNKIKAIDCLPEQRNVDGCIEIYQPVCGQVRVECIKAPCDLVKETFENYCKACVNPRVVSYTVGECSEDSGIKY